MQRKVDKKMVDTTENGASKNRRRLTGTVVSDKMQKTVTVLVVRKVKHPLYNKVIGQSKKIHCDIGALKPSMGELVMIEECRPISKTKAWQVIEILRQAA